MGFNDLQLGCCHAARDAKIFKKVIKLGLFGAGHAVGVRKLLDHLALQKIGDHKPCGNNGHDKRPIVQGIGIAKAHTAIDGVLPAIIIALHIAA